MTSKPVTILHLLGNNGTGKTTLLDTLVERNAYCAGISVGRELRKRHPPEYFQGQAAPAHTESAAMELYRNFVDTTTASGYQLIVVDGQPRNASQVTACLLANGNHEFLLLHAPHAVRHERLIRRDGADLSKLALATARLDADYRNQYEVMVELARLGIELQIADTASLSFQAMVDEIEATYLT